MDKLISCLMKWGLSPNEAKVYSVLVSCAEPVAAPHIARLSDVRRAETYRALAGLEAKGLVFRIIGFPTRFQALGLKKGLEVFIKEREQSLIEIRRIKDEIVREFLENQGDPLALAHNDQLKIIKQQKNIAKVVREMFLKAGWNSCDLIGVIGSSGERYAYSILAEMKQQKKKVDKRIRIITTVTDRNKDWVKAAMRVAKVHHTGSPPNTMFVAGENEMIQSFGLGDEPKDEVAIWTESQNVVLGARQMLENLWNSSADVESRILDLETGIPTEEFRIIRSRREILSEIRSSDDMAKEELAILTTPSILRSGRIVFDPAIDEAKARGVRVRMIASIDSTNLDNARTLMKLVELRHFPVDPVFTIGFSDNTRAILANWRPDRFDIDEEDARDVAFSTNLPENVRGLKGIFDAMWKQSTPAETRIQQLELDSKPSKNLELPPRIRA